MDNFDETQKLKQRIAQLEKINSVLMDRVEKTFSFSNGSFSLFQKNSVLVSEIEQKTTQLNAAVDEVKKQNRAINGALIISETDVRGIITYANEKFCEISQYSLGELVGKSHSLVNSNFHPPEFWNEFWQTLKSGKTYRGEICNVSKGGSTYWVDTAIYPNKDKDGLICGYTSVRLDVTERKLEQMKIQHTEKLAAIGELASGIGHEINNPLAVSDGNVTLLKRALVKDQLDLNKINGYLDKIITANNRIASIVNGLRIFSRSESEKLEHVSIRTSVLHTLDLVQEIYSNQGIHILFKSRCESDLFAYVNAGKLQQILFNLLSNAKDATENKLERVIDIGLLENEKNELVLSVLDNGIGIPAGIIHRITEPFFTTKPVGKGTGIGLGLVSGFIKNSKGRLEIESIEGAGSTFKVILPISKKEMKPNKNDSSKDKFPIQIKRAQ